MAIGKYENYKAEEVSGIGSEEEVFEESLGDETTLCRAGKREELYIL